MIEALCEEPAPVKEKAEDEDDSGEVDGSESGAARSDADGGSEDGNGTETETDGGLLLGDEASGEGAADRSLEGRSVGDVHSTDSDADGGSDGSADEGSADQDHDDDDDGGHDGHHHGNGDEDLPTWQRFKDRVHSTLRGVTAASLGADMVAAGSEAPVPPWPHPSLEPDLAKAFGLTEILGDKSTERQAQLVERMDTAEKRVWLNQRLFRAHQGDQMDDELLDEPLAFIECDREGCPMNEMRMQWEGKTGIGDDISGIVEVRFKGESSVGSAVLREWMAHTVTAGFLNPANNLVASNDGGRTFTLSPSRHETHPETYLLDYEIMGRFVGAAMLHRVCVGLRFHPTFCRLILADNTAWRWTDKDVKEFDPLLYRNLVEYVRAADEEELEELELTFTDVQDWLSDASDEGKRVSPAVAQASVDLVTGGSDLPVTTGNRLEYIDAVVERRLFGSIEEQTAAFLTGLHTIVPNDIFRSLRGMITPIELQELVAGLPTIEIEDWRKHTEYGGGFKKRSKVIRWFWEAVTEELFTKEELELILQFATGE